MDSINIKAKALELGYANCGIIPADTFYEYEKYLSERAEKFPDSRIFYDPLNRFIYPEKECRSIIVCLRGMTQYILPNSLLGRIGKFYMFDTRIEYSNDYRIKKEFEKYLELQGLQIIPNSVPARWAAVKAGIAKFGYNNFVYDPTYGSYITIETFSVDKELEYDSVPDNIYLSACNENCKECIKACPTGALSDKFSMEFRKCITHLTTNPNANLDEITSNQMGEWIYGCDVCQDSCPYNKGRFTGTEEYPLLSDFEEYLKLENIASMSDETYEKIIYPRFWYAGAGGVSLWRRNARRSLKEKQYYDYE